MLALSAARAAAAAADAGLACISVSVLVLISIRFLFFCLSFNFAFHRQLLHPPNEPPPVYVSALLSRKTRRLFAFCEQPLPRARLVIDCSKTKSSPIKKAQRFFRRFRRRRGHTPVFPQLQTIPGLIRRVAWRAALGFRLRGTHWGKVMRCLDQSIPGSRTASLMCVCELPFPARQARTSELIVDAEGRRLLSWKFATNFSENSDRIAFRLSALPFEFRQLFHFSNSQIVPKLIRNFPKISSRSSRHLKLLIFNFFVLVRNFWHFNYETVDPYQDRDNSELYQSAPLPLIAQWNNFLFLEAFKSQFLLLRFAFFNALLGKINRNVAISPTDDLAALRNLDDFT
jgi:hypothetical protein